MVKFNQNNLLLGHDYSGRDNVFENGILAKILDFVGLKACIDLKIFLGKQNDVGYCQKNFF